MKTFDVLSSHLDLDQSYFLESSAGTGKTFSIEHFVARQIIEKGISIDRILVVTFTKKATNELKIRLFENLQKLSHQIHENSSPFEYIRAYQKSSQKKLYLERLKVALLNFDLINVFTIHSFCLNLLQKEYPQMELENELQEHKLLRDFFYASSFENEFFPSQLQKNISLFPI